MTTHTLSGTGATPLQQSKTESVLKVNIIILKSCTHNVHDGTTQYTHCFISHWKHFIMLLLILW